MTKSGTVSTSTASVFTCDNKLGANILSMRFTNDIDYTIELFLYVAKDNKTIDLYTLILDGGDVVTDNLLYELAFGDKILARSTVANTFYTLNIE
jgi:hypothetical protein